MSFISFHIVFVSFSQTAREDHRTLLSSQVFDRYTSFGWDGMTQTNSTFFQNLPPIYPENGVFTITVNPDEMYTITTLTTGFKATIPASPEPQPFPTFYSDDFENYTISSEARYFTDQTGLAAQDGL